MTSVQPGVYSLAQFNKRAGVRAMVLSDARRSRRDALARGDAETDAGTAQQLEPSRG
jgi:hypothetical protein